MLSLRQCFIFLVCAFWSVFVSASLLSHIPPKSKPRYDLYQKIQKRTGLSLRQVYNVVFGRDKMAIHHLIQHTKINGVKGIRSEIQGEIDRQSRKCESKKGGNRLYCQGQVNQLKKQLALITNKNWKQKAKKDPKMRLYWDLEIMAYSIRYKILKSQYRKWEKECYNDETQLNTRKCQNQFFEVDLFYTIAKALAYASYMKAKNINHNYENRKKELDILIKRYEAG